MLSHYGYWNTNTGLHPVKERTFHSREESPTTTFMVIQKKKKIII